MHGQTTLKILFPVPWKMFYHTSHNPARILFSCKVYPPFGRDRLENVPKTRLQVLNDFVVISQEAQETSPKSELLAARPARDWRNRISTPSTRRYNNEMHYHHNSDMSLNK